jgi:hypothetical protein
MGNMNEHHKDQKENQIKLSGSGYDQILDLAISDIAYLHDGAKKTNNCDGHRGPVRGA